ncbi:MAG: hypothetical protein JXR68_06960 [Bacteroidales bacterium]|nr:hypothetical protein [Bacteroidales bacterium]
MKIYLIFLIFIGVFSASAQISIFADFENGNAELIYSNDSLNSVLIKPSLENDVNTTRCWFNFGLIGYDTSKICSVEIEFVNYIMAPQYPVFSYDMVNWQRIETSYTETKSVRFTHKFHNDTVYIAAGYPYTYSKIISFVDSISVNKYVDTSTLVYSEGGLRVPLIVIGNKNSNAKDVVWIIGRQHAFETTMNYTLEGFIKFLISDDKKAHKMRKKTLIYVVPMVDVDNVFLGASGRMQKPVDFNRDWSLNSHWKAVKRIQELIRETNNKYNYRVFLDFHSTYPGASKPIFGIFNEYTQLQAEFHRLRKFLNIYEKNAGYPLTEIRGTMDNFYADAFSSGLRDPDINVSGFSTTVECDWNNNHNGKPLNVYELRMIGMLMAESLCDYLK